MSWWSRIANLIRGDGLSREIDEELQSHIDEAIAQGRDPDEAQRAFGPALRLREESSDLRLIPWLDSLRSDAVFGWRQLRKRRLTSAAAILSLALAIGACTSAFRLIDALLLRPLPVAEPGQLYAVSFRGMGFDGKPQASDRCAYPMFRQMRAVVKDQAELLAISYANRTDLTYGSDQEMEKAHLQYVSGWMFGSFGIQPALGRLFTDDDDLKPGAHAYAVLSYDYWTRRFAQEPRVIGRSFRMGNGIYVIIGVAAEGFTGIEPGTMTDIFVPTMMNASIDNPNATWFRTLVRLKPGVAVEAVREKLHATFRAFRKERADGFAGMPRQSIANFLNQRVLLEAAGAGVSEMQKDYRRSLAALAVLVALVLLIACANVANLMTAQASARAREMALRVSIGAGRWRLVQLVLVESAILAFLAAAIGGLFAWWSAPLVVSMINPPDNPARLSLPADWRVLGFGLALTLGVTFLFGLIPALRASGVRPVSVLKGGEDPHGRRRWMHALIAAQVAFSFLVLFVAGLFVATFDRLSKESTGFSAERLLTVDLDSPRGQPPASWDQVVEHLRGAAGVDAVALAEWPLLSENASQGYISIDGGRPSEDPAWFLDVSPGWIGAMKIPLIDGRDFRAGDAYPRVAIVNEAFARRYFGGEKPVGKSFGSGDGSAHLEIVGLVRDARYAGIRGPIAPVVCVPFRSVDSKGALRLRRFGTLIVRTASSNPLALASILRQEVTRAQPEFRITNIRTQTEINESHSIRERLLAMLALFFATGALLLAGVGLYGVLDYSVLQRRREIGIRMAIGGQASGIARLVTRDVFSMVFVGALAGLALGMASVRYIETLLYQVRATDFGMLVLPGMVILGTAVLAALPAVIRAVRIDPVQMLRAE